MSYELLCTALMFGVHSDTAKKKCITEGNKLTHQIAREIVHTEEATKMQLAAMTNYNQVNLLDKKDFSKDKTQRAKPSQKKNQERGDEVTKGKNLNRLTNLILDVGDVVVHLMITRGNVQ